MQSQESDQIIAFLADQVVKGADAPQLAAVIGKAYQDIEIILTPIIGKRGAAALFKRSLHLTALTHPWMLSGHVGGEVDVDIEKLKSVLMQQTSVEAAAGGGFLLQTFYELLATLVGRSLAGRLLRSVWITFLSGSAAREMSK